MGKKKGKTLYEVCAGEGLKELLSSGAGQNLDSTKIALMVIEYAHHLHVVDTPTGKKGQFFRHSPPKNKKDHAFEPSRNGVPEGHKEEVSLVS